MRDMDDPAPKTVLFGAREAGVYFFLNFILYLTNTNNISIGKVLQMTAPQHLLFEMNGQCHPAWATAKVDGNMMQRINMRRNFVDQDALHAEIDKLIADLSMPLSAFSEPLNRLFHRNLPELRLGMRTLPKSGDPAWSHKKAADGEPLFRLGAEGLLDARIAMIDFFLAIEKAIWIAGNPSHPCRRAVKKTLEGMSHWKPSADDDDWCECRTSTTHRIDLAASMGIRDLLQGACEAEEAQRSKDSITTPAKISAGALSGERMTSVHRIMKLGREARNCLAGASVAQKVAQDGDDIWEIRADKTLIAIMWVSAKGCVKELRGPANGSRLGGYGADLALFCQKGNFRVDDDITISLADLVPPENQVTPLDANEEKLRWQRLLDAA